MTAHPERPGPKILPAGDSAALVEFGDRIDPETNDLVYSLASAVEAASIKGFQELVPTYRSLLVQYDLHAIGYEEVSSRLRKIVEQIKPPVGNGDAAKIVVKIPVAYGGESGADLQTVAEHSGLSEQDVIGIHSGTDYRVFMLGFAPGFPYLGGMDERIACPRLKTPRVRVPGGSVGIAESQTGVYPNDSPGGWQIIGHTPVKLFDSQANPPAAILPGSLVRFEPVDPDQYQAIASSVEAGEYQLKRLPGTA